MASTRKSGRNYNGMNPGQIAAAEKIYAAEMGQRQYYKQDIVEGIENMPDGSGIRSGEISGLRTGQGYSVPQAGDRVEKRENYRQGTAVQGSFDATMRDLAGRNLGVMGGVTVPDPLDDQYQVMKKYVTPEGFVPGIGKSIIGPEYFAYAQRKRNEQMRADFEQYKMEQVDLTRPETRRYWETKQPELTEKVIRGYEDQLMRMNRNAMIQIHGIQGEDDMMFMFQQKMNADDMQAGPGAPAPVVSQTGWFDSLRNLFTGLTVNGMPPAYTGLGRDADNALLFPAGETQFYFNQNNTSRPPTAPPRNNVGFLLQ